MQLVWWKNLYLSSNGSLLKKRVPKTGFQPLRKRFFFSVLDICRKTPNFAVVWCPNYLTHTGSWGINRKIICISFIWHPFLKKCFMDEATMTFWKSGLILSAVKILISVLCNIAVLAWVYRIFYDCLLNLIELLLKISLVRAFQGEELRMQ